MLNDNHLDYKVLYEESADPVFIIQGGAIKDCNKATLEILNIDSKEAIRNLKLWELSPVYQPDGMLSSKKGPLMLYKAIDKGYHEFDWVHTVHHGTETWFNVQLKKISADGSNLIHALCHDITKRKNAENALEKAIDEKNKFISVLTHDLRGSVGGSLPLIDLLELNGSQWNRREEITAHIFRNINKSFELLDKLVTWGKLSDENDQAVLTEISLDKLFNNLTEQYKVQLLYKELSFIRSCNSDQLLVTDEYMLENVLRNLVSICIKKSEPQSSINYSYQSTDESIKIVIENTGLDIDVNKVNALFSTESIAAVRPVNLQDIDMGLEIIKENLVKLKGIISLKIKDSCTVFCLTFPS
ncbi:PAS domain S-box protein [Carboxylicivirga marina]|uniref:PAS domain S-box protein n=1 Tax=Carboxylicivirga marina TaxID=2800988 RepID=UPI0025994FF9|nr:PAS domain S-box protein [uncultured Carboxylicivirga sp.]